MTIRDFTNKPDGINYKDLLDYVEFNVDEFKLREVVSNTFWNIEAYIECFKDNKSFLVVFNKDVISPYRGYTHLEMDELINKLLEQAEQIKIVLNV